MTLGRFIHKASVSLPKHSVGTPLSHLVLWSHTGLIICNVLQANLFCKMLCLRVPLWVSRHVPCCFNKHIMSRCGDMFEHNLLGDVHSCQGEVPNSVFTVRTQRSLCTHNDH